MPRGVCGSPSSTTPRDAGQPGLRFSRVITPSRFAATPFAGVPSGAAGTRPKWAKLLPEMLRPLGYRSYHCGKWHVDGMPLQAGFDRSYYLEDVGRYFYPRVYFEDDQQQPPIEPGSGFYATTAIADHGIGFLTEHAAKLRSQPFFLYLAFNAPAFPAPGESR